MRIYIYIICCILSLHKYGFSQSLLSPNDVFVLHDEIVRDSRYVSCSSTPELAASLPFGIIKEIGSKKYIIAVDSAVFLPSITYLRAYMAMDFPQSDERIAFAAQNIQFNPKGVSGGSFSRLMLLTKHTISLGPKVKMIIEPNGRNFVEWDCNGYKAVNLSGYFEFANTMLVPDPDASNDSVVRASFEIYTQDIHNFIAQVSISPFTIKGLNDFSFSVLDATVDMSELLNAPGMAFPADYPNSSSENINNWTGFFLKQVKVKLPPEFSKGEQRIELYADNFLIDNMGVSGIFGANNVLTLSEGSMSGWGFSVDNISVGVVANKLTGGAMAGSVVLPIANQNPIQYTAAVMYNSIRQEADYVFTVQPQKDISVPAFSAKMDLYNTSRITVGKVNGRFKPEAFLNGKITVDNELAKVKGIAFEQLILITEKPFITNGVFGLVASSDTGNNVSRFSITINNFMLYVNESAPAIGFDAAFNFMSKEDKGLAAASRIMVIANVQNNGNAIDYGFDRIAIGNVSLEANTSFFQLNGTVMFHRNDPVYGNGFFGSISMQFEKFIETPVVVNACFGNTGDYKYWFVDAMVPIKIPIGSGLSIYRLIGGLRYHMSQNTNVNLASMLYANPPAGTLKYFPDKTAGLAFIAGVTLAPDVNDKTINGDVAFEIAFNSTGGLSTVTLAGNVFSMISISDRLKTAVSSLPVRASMIMIYDHNNNAFHAVMDAVIKRGNLIGAGQCVLHYDPEVKYLCIGKPSTPVLVSLANIASVQAYFMMGNRLEPMPPPPSLVTNVVNNNGLYNMRDNDKLITGRGFAFGARINNNIYKDKSVRDYTAYASFGLTIGFDMMLVDYGKNATCSNTGARAGIDGWYTTGQAYAAMQGIIGFKGQFLKEPFDVKLIDGTIAALLYAQLPNPYYFSGSVACEYNILSCIKGNFDFDFSLGNSCNVVN